jgi:hypothetical protein
MDFKLESEYQPTGDQPEAIRQLVQGINDGLPAQTLLGVTGSGKNTTKHLLHNFTESSNNFFRRMRSNILFPITIIISLRLISR